MTPFISVVIPTFNRRPLLLAAVTSVLGQTFRDLEAIVVDDGSTDGTARAVTSIRDARLSYLFQENRGVSAARNLGILRARGEWIALLDSDDRWLPQKLERQHQELERNPDFRIAHCEEIWYRRNRRVNPRKIHLKRGGWIYRHCLPRCVISPSAVLIHRRLIEEVGGFDESMPVCEDYDLWLRICSRQPVHLLEEQLVVKAGGHADQLSRSTWGLDRFRIRAMEKIYESGNLTPQQAVWTAAELRSKAGILAEGAQKRGHTERARFYRRLQNKWTQRLQGGVSGEGA